MPDAMPVLSEREIEIMEQVVTGLSNREIARNLDISPNTVKVHLRNIFEKLEVQSRTEATLYVLREGWIQVDNRVTALSGTTTTTSPVITPQSEDFEDNDLDEEFSGNGVSESVAGSTRNEALAEMPTAQEATSVSATTETLTLPPIPDASTTLVPTSVRPLQQATVLRPMAPSGYKAPTWLLALVSVGIMALLIVVTVLLWRTMIQSPAGAIPNTDTGTGGITYVAEPSRWKQGVVLPTPRRGVVAAKIGQNLVVAGGRLGDNPTDEVWWFDSAEQVWQPRAALPQPIQAAEATLSGGAWVIVGGIGANDAPVATVQRYSPQNDSWQEIAPLPVPLARGALVAFEGSLYYLGGWDGETIQDTIFRLAPNADTWEAAGTLPEARANLAAVALPDGILLLGGVDKNERPLNDVLHFSPNAASPFREESPLPAPDSNPRVAALGSAVYLLGVQGFLERDPDQKWRSIASPETPLPTDSALIANDPFILVIGGQRGNDTVDEVWQYQAIYRSFMPIVPNQGNSPTP